MDIRVRYASADDLDQVNLIRREVNDLHVQGRADFFRADAWPSIEGHAADLLNAPDAGLIVAECGGQIAGFATVEYFVKPANPYMRERRYYHVEEFGVSSAFRRCGVGTALIDFMKEDARARGFDRIELDMWEFNRSALAFYEHTGFTTYRRYMELSASPDQD